MKVFENFGNKAENILKLKSAGFCIPKTWIIGKNNINLDFLRDDILYILRPSFLIEDGLEKSFAGKFKSLFPLKKEEVVMILQKSDLNKIFNGEGFELKSIIVQEFVQKGIYGVYFTRNPDNVFYKGFSEVSNSNDGITAGKIESIVKLSFLQQKELEFIGIKLEKIFNCPQDIEFVISEEKVILLQTRPITTGNNTIYSFKEILKFNGVYRYVDFDEFGDKQDLFSYEVLKNLFDCIYVDEKIYFKRLFLSSKVDIDNTDLKLFLQNYRRYLFQKLFYNIVKFFSFQRLDLKVLDMFFKDYSYSFLLNKKSNLDLRFDYKTNFITKFFLKVESKKNIAFGYLEAYKKQFKTRDFKQSKYGFGDKLVFYKGVIINKNLVKKEKLNYIYKGEIKGTITDIKNFDYKKNNQILISQDLNFELYDKLENISGVIIKKGNKLSHNSIIFREYKIPSVINYDDFDSLKIGNEISLK